LKSNIDNVAKENAELQKAIDELKKAQAELILAQQEEIERLQNLVHEDEEVSEVDELTDIDEVPVATTLDNGRQSLRIPL
jgi:acetyl-CoA carboxylase alpha subunit